MADTPRDRDAVGSVVGLATFLGGVALMVLVFRLGYGMFGTPAHEALGLKDGQAMDLNQVGPNFAGILIRILLLLVLGVMASLIANRGIGLYTASRGLRPKTPVPEPKAEQPDSDA